MWKGLAAALIRALERAHRWKRMVEEGRYRSTGELAEADCIDRSFVTRLLRLTPPALQSSRRSSRACRRRGMVPEASIELRVNDAGKHLDGPHMLPIDKIKGCLHACKCYILIPDNLYPPNTEEVCYGNSDRNLP
jgi:hypothetical protein